MSDDSVTFCDSDEEFFCGKVTEKELMKRANLGINYSPLARPCTPRANAALSSISVNSTLPDVLRDSSFTTEPSASNVEADDVIIIDLDSQNDSVQIISDDDSFLETDGVPKRESFCQDLSLSDKVKLGDVNSSLHQDCEANDKETTKTDIVNPISIDALIQASIQLEIENKSPDHTNKDAAGAAKPSVEKSKLSFVECSLLSGVSDSILNISDGSSLSSSLVEPVIGSTTISQAIYEDISCDGEQLLSTIHTDDKLSQSDDLQMSVDESELHENHFTNNFSEMSSYYSAYTSVGLSTSEQTSDAFHSYRDNVNLSSVEGVDNEAETSFEIIVQNRQNSFASSSLVSAKEQISEVNSTEHVKSKFVSKLPVFSSSSNLLKPAILNVKMDTLGSCNTKWAKSFSKPNKYETSTVSGLKSKIPSFTDSKSKTPNMKTANHLPNKTKTPSEHKTPASLLARPSKTVTSERKNLSSSKKKTPSTIKPLNIFASNDHQIQTKDRYKNIISPIRAYITGAPVVLIQKPVVQDEMHVVANNSNMTVASHIPLSNNPTKAVQKLHFGNSQGQENLDPNYTRDTLPPVALQSASAVFLREPEQPRRRLPKMGGTMQKLLDTPRPKITVHQGRVEESPKTKGVLIKTTVTSPGQKTENRISVRLVKSPERSNFLK